MNCSPATRQPGSSGRYAEDRRALPFHCRGHLCATAAPVLRHGRRGEALALRWSDVDLTNSILRVRGTLFRVNGHLVISEPKTERLRRDVPLSPATCGALG